MEGQERVFLDLEPLSHRDIPPPRGGMNTRGGDGDDPDAHSHGRDQVGRHDRSVARLARRLVAVSREEEVV